MPDAGVSPIPHDALARSQLPHPRAPFEEVVAFAYTFDGYQCFGMRLCGEIANRAIGAFLDRGELPSWLTGDLDRLRGCLYFESRRWIVLGREPDTRSLIYVHRLIDAIGDAIDAGAEVEARGAPVTGDGPAPAAREAPTEAARDDEEDAPR